MLSEVGFSPEAAESAHAAILDLGNAKNKAQYLERASRLAEQLKARVFDVLKGEFGEGNAAARAAEEYNKFLKLVADPALASLHGAHLRGPTAEEEALAKQREQHAESFNSQAATISTNFKRISDSMLGISTNSKLLIDVMNTLVTASEAVASTLEKLEILWGKMPSGPGLKEFLIDAQTIGLGGIAVKAAIGGYNHAEPPPARRGKTGHEQLPDIHFGAGAPRVPGQVPDVPRVPGLPRFPATDGGLRPMRFADVI